MPTSYQIGTVSVAQGSTTLTGTGTLWLAAGLRPGDIFAAEGLTVSIASINGPGLIALSFPWPGGALTDAAYEIRYTADAARVLAASREAIQKFEANFVNLDLIEVATGAPGTDVAMIGGVLTVPQGLPGAVDFDDVTIATGAAGSAVTYSPQTQTMTIPRGADGDVSAAQLDAALDEPRAAPLDQLNQWHVLMQDRGGQMLLALTEDGLHFQPSSALMDVLSPALATTLANDYGVGGPSVARQVDGGWSIIEDAGGQTLLKLMTDGLSFQPSAEVIELVRQRLAANPLAANPLTGFDQDVVTLTICLTQSLLYMNGDSAVAPIYPDVDPVGALMIGGLKRSDGVTLDISGPRSWAYDTATPGTGFVTPDPTPADPGGAYYAVKGYNGWRAKHGLIARRNVGTLWGMAGDHITRYNDIIGDAPSSFTDNTLHWDNLMFWLDEASRLAALQGLSLRVDLLVTQGTSSKQDGDPLLHAATLRALIPALRAEFDARGFEDAVIYFTQPGGDADTSASVEHWHVTQSYLDLAAEGYGVLVAPEAYIGIFDNNVHFDEIEGEPLLGMFNWARAAREAGRSWTILPPVVTRAGLVVTLDYQSLWDGEMWEVEPDRYAGQGIDQYHGYTCDGASITAIEIIGRKVRLTFDQVPLWIDYMMQHQDVTVINDGYTAFRGRMVTTTRMRDPLNPAINHRRRMPSHGVAVPQ